MIGLHVGQVCMLFQLPAQFGQSNHPLTYIEWFRPLRTLDCVTGMYNLKWLTARTRQHAEIVSVHRIWLGCHLIPCFGHSDVPPSWDRCNVLESADNFLFNHYINLYQFEDMEFKG